MCVLEIFDGVPGVFDGFQRDSLSVSWRYLIGVLKIFHQCPGDILWVSCKNLMGILEIFDR